MSSPTLSRSKVTKCGKRLGEYVRAGGVVRSINDDHQLAEDLQVAQLWRASFAEPLGRTNVGLRSFLATCGLPGSPTQRHKKLERIISKLARPSPTSLAGMQDIGGVRVVLDDLPQLRQLEDHIRSRWTEDASWPEAAVVDKLCRDYVTSPQASGYRTVPLIVPRMDRLVEVQLRTRDQQIWADHVEEISRLIGCELKSETGPPEVEQFFRDWGDCVGLTGEGQVVDATLTLDLEAHGYPGTLEVTYG